MWTPDGTTFAHFNALELSGLVSLVVILPAFRAFKLVRAFIRG